MSYLIWLIIGVVIGCLGSLIMRCDTDRSVVLSTLAGILGALLAGRLLAPFLGRATEGSFNLSVLLVSLLGAVLLVGAANLLRLGRVH
ncbi:MAG: GlsB/YeaQ/YmgE family stress response membrane protein [Steroidobacteraceae bacterium]